MISNGGTSLANVLDALIEADNRRNVDEFIRALVSVAAEAPNATLEDVVEDTKGARGVVAAGLAVMLHSWGDVVRDSEASRLVQAIFDACFMPIYKLKNLDKNAQTYEKRQVVVEVLNELLSELTRLANTSISVDMFAQIRERYLRCYNSERAKLLLHPLLPDTMQSVLPLNSVFKSIERFLAESGGERRQAAMQAVAAMDSFEVQFAGVPELLRDAVAAPLRSIFTAVKNSWDVDPANLQASLTLEQTVRGYPLNEKGRAIDISVALRNNGPGVAWDVEITYITDLAFSDQTAYIGTLEPGVLLVDLRETVREPIEGDAQVSCGVSWTDSSGPQRSEHVFHIKCQRSDTDWDTLRRGSPYSTEPVFKPDQFFGRQEKIDAVIAKLSQEQMPSFYVVGQKRVGKTSFVQRIEEVIRSSPELGAETIFVSPEYFIASNAAETVARLSQYIADELRKRFHSLRLPAVEARELQDLNVLFESIGSAGRRVIIAIDEFDEIPAGLYEEQSELSSPFFLALRGSSSQPHVSFIIVGSEKLDLIMQQQGQRLNKWLPEKLDYFSKDTGWNDYRDLITRPVEHQIDFGDEAISRLYDITAGHPYFTKQICQRVIEIVSRERISWVGRQIVDDACDQLVEQLDSGPFQHFWKDGLVGSKDEQDQGRYLRQCLLLAMSDIARKQPVLSRKAVFQHQSVIDVQASASDQLGQFFARKIVKGTMDGFEFRLKFFERWLQHKGTEQIGSTMRDPSGIIQQLRAKADRAIKSDELSAVSEHWVYKGHRISTDEVRRWLGQFGAVDEQRLVFPVLQNLKFVTAEAYMPTFRAYSADIQRRLPTLLAAKAKKRGDMLVSYLGSPGKSGTELARKFADAAKILTDRIVERGKLRAILEPPEDDQSEAFGPVQALIFVDDFIGTGGSACAGIEELASECGDLLEDRGTFIFYLCVVATTTGRDKLLELGKKKFGAKFEVRVVTLLGEEAKLFSELSEVYPNADERTRARELFAKFGAMLEPGQPLGYGDGQLAVAFETTCPNNSVPVLWKDKGTWSALFS